MTIYELEEMCTPPVVINNNPFLSELTEGTLFKFDLQHHSNSDLQMRFHGTLRVTNPSGFSYTECEVITPVPSGRGHNFYKSRKVIIVNDNQ